MNYKVARLLLLTSKANTVKGFSLLELILVVTIIAVLAALSIPSLLSAANQTREAQAATNAGAVADLQLRYRGQNPRFAETLEELDIRTIPAETRFYSYRLTSTPTEATFQAIAKDPALRSLSSTVTAPAGDKVLCRTEEASTTPPAVVVTNGIVSCGAGSERIE